MRLKSTNKPALKQKMEEKKITKKKSQATELSNSSKQSKGSSMKDKTSCADKFCPVHGEKKLKIRGRIFEGEVIKKHHGRVTIQFTRMFKIRKYERYEKRRTKIHARLPQCMEEDINVGDLIQVAETRPISKMIHFVVIKKIGGKNEH